MPLLPAEKQRNYRQRVKQERERLMTLRDYTINIPKAIRAAADAGDIVALGLIADTDIEILRKLEVMFLDKVKKNGSKKKLDQKISEAQK